MILYSIIARSDDGIILTEATTAGIEGNHPQVIQSLLGALIENPLLISEGNHKTFAHTPNDDYEDDINNVESGRRRSRSPFKSIRSRSKSKSRERSGVGHSSASASVSVGGGGGGGGAILENYFHCVRGLNTYYIALSDDRDSLQQKINLGFLLNVQREFTHKFTPNRINKAITYGFDKQFSRTLSNLMHHCNTNRNSEYTTTNGMTDQLTSEVISMQKTLGYSIDLLMQRGEKYETLVEQSEDLLVESEVFNKRSTKLKRVIRTRNMRYKLILVGFFVFMIYLMLATICGFDLSCAAEDDG